MKRREYTISRRVEKDMNGCSGVDHLDMLVQHFVIVDNDDQDEEKGEEVSN